MNFRQGLLDIFTRLCMVFCMLCIFQSIAAIADDAEAMITPVPTEDAWSQKATDEDYASWIDALSGGQDRVPVMIHLAPTKEIKTIQSELARNRWQKSGIRAQLRDAVAECQSDFLGGYKSAGRELAVKVKLQNFPSLITDVDQDTLLALMDDPRVVSLEAEMMLEMHTAEGIPQMNATAVRSQYTGAGMAIAICDTGVDYTHPKLGGGGFPNDKVLGGYDYGNNDSNPMPSGQAHGTACAGISAGDVSSSTGSYIGGVAPDAKLYALKISPDGSGSASSYAMISAWDWCVTHQNDNPDFPIMIISTSFGGGRYYSYCDSASYGMTQAATNAVAAGITLFVSSGNDAYNESMGWPACISNVISVGAVYDFDGPGYGFSACQDVPVQKNHVTCYTNMASFLTLHAPSHNAYTPDIRGGSGYSSGDYTTNFGGTSAACPYAAGAGAVLQQAALELTGSYLTPAELESTFVSTGLSITDSGSGITKPQIDLGAAVELITPAPTPTPTPTPEPNPQVSLIRRNTPSQELVNTTTVIFRVIFDKPVKNVKQSNFSLTTTGSQTGATIDSITHPGDYYLVTVNTVVADAAGTIRLDLSNPTGITDDDGNPLLESHIGDELYQVDFIAPQVESILRHGPTDELTSADVLIWRVTFNEAVKGVTTSSFSVTATGGQTGAAVLSVSASEGEIIDVRMETVEDAAGTVRLDLSSIGTIRDTAGSNLSSTHQGDEIYTVDRVRPQVVSITRQEPAERNTNASQLRYRVLFDEPVIQVQTANFTVQATDGQAGAWPASVQKIAGDTYDVLVNTLAGESGTIDLDLTYAGQIQDQVGNRMIELHPGDEDYFVDRVAPLVTSIERYNPASEITNASELVFLVTFSRAVSGVAIGNFDVTASDGQTEANLGAVSALNSQQYLVTVAPVPFAVGEVRLDLDLTTGIVDEYGNHLQAAFEGDEAYFIDIAPQQPEGVLPADGATDQRRTLTLGASAFSDPNPGDTQQAAHWQLRPATTPEDYSSAIYGEVVTTAPFDSLDIAPGLLNLITEYRWRVRYQDEHGVWSAWSDENSFTTEDGAYVPSAPDKPVALFPGDTQTGVAPDVWLTASAFSDADVGDYMTAAQWQLRTTAGNFTAPAYDSGVLYTDATEWTVPEETLNASTEYYWHVRYRDSRGAWSAYSDEVSLTTKAADDLPVPEGLLVAAGADSSLSNWQAARDADVTGWRLERADSEGGPYSSVVELDVALTEYLDSGLATPADYYYRLVALGEASAESTATLPVLAQVGAVQLGMTNLRGEPGETVTQTIYIDNPNQIVNEGLQLNILYDPAFLTPLAVHTTALTENFALADNVVSANGTLTIAGVGAGAVINGYGAILTVDYQVANDAVLWERSALSFGTVELVDDEARTLNVAKLDAELTVAVTSAAPVVSSIVRSVPATQLTTAETLVFEVNFSAPVNLISVDDFAITGGEGQTGATVRTVSASQGQTVLVTVATVADAEGSVRLDLVNPLGILDDAGRPLGGTFRSGESYLVDRLAPSVLAIERFQPLTAVTGASAVAFHVLFSEPVINVHTGNFSLETSGGQSTANIASVSSNQGESILVSVVTASLQAGTIRLDLSDPGSIRDDAGHALSGSFALGDIYQIDLAPEAPSVIAPVDSAAGVALTPTLEVTTFFDPNVTDLVQASQWQLRYDEGPSDFSQVLFEWLGLEYPYHQAAVPEGVLIYETPYAWRVRYQDEHGVWGEWSTTARFTTLPQPTPPSAPVKPVNLSPANGLSGVSVTPTLVATDFEDADPGESMLGAQWQLHADGGSFASPLHDTGTRWGNSTQYSLPAAVLAMNTTYFWRERYLDAKGLWSDWSDATDFTTINLSAIPTPAGFALEQGVDTIALSWDSVDDERVAGYYVYRATVVSGPYAQQGGLVSETVWVDEALPAGTTYYYRVTATDDDGTESAQTQALSGAAGHVRLTLNDIGGMPGTDVLQQLSAGYVTGIANRDLEIRISYDPSVIDPLEVRRGTATAGFSYSNNASSASGELIILGQAVGPVVNVEGSLFEILWHVLEDAEVPTNSTISFGSATLKNNAGDMLSVDVSETALFQTIAPTAPPEVLSITRQTPLSEQTDEASLEWRVTFSEPVYHVTAGNFALTASGGQIGAAITGLSAGSGNTIDITVSTIDGAVGTLRLDLSDASGIQNQYGVGLAAGRAGDESYWVDREEPMVTGIERRSPTQEYTDAAQVIFGVNFSESVTGVTSAAFSIAATGGQSGATIHSVSMSDGDTAEVIVNAVADVGGELTINLVAPGAISDALGNAMTETFNGTARYTFNLQPRAPVAITPAPSAVDVAPDVTLGASAFDDPDSWDSHQASQWQLHHKNSSNDFSELVFDSGIDSTALEALPMPAGTLEYKGVYFWRVRYQDSVGSWSEWSTPASFTVQENAAPARPTNLTPGANATGISVLPTLSATDFSDSGDPHVATQWQMREQGSAGDYSSTVYDSSESGSPITSLELPVSLSLDTTYLWRVRYQDIYGLWSAWSFETAFTTGANLPPAQPSGISPGNMAIDVTLTPTLSASAFSDPNGDDYHASSQWELCDSDENVILDSGATATALTSISVAGGVLEYLSNYCWRVRYQDGNGQWSPWSQLSYFTTEAPPNETGYLRRAAGGMINLTTIDATHDGLTVSPGEILDGEVVVEAENLLAEMATPLVAIAVWGERTSAYTIADNWIETGTQTYHIPVSLAAPEAIGVYYWLVVFDGGRSAEEIASAVDAAVTPGWNDGNDVGFDWDETWLESALDEGAVLTSITGASGAVQHWLPVVAVRVEVTIPPDQPVNIAPASGTTDEALTPTLSASAFSSSMPGATHADSQWQMRAAGSASDFSATLFDVAAGAADTSYAIPEGILNYSTMYFWRVRYQDDLGGWSPWSEATAFTTSDPAPTFPPTQPVNDSPPANETNVDLVPVLVGSAFSDPDAGDYLTASQWRMRFDAGTYESAVYDSGVVSSPVNRHALPADLLFYGTTYYWQVRYRDSRGEWSPWSAETAFTTVYEVLPIAVPTGVKATGGVDSVWLTWDVHPDPRVVGYRIYRLTMPSDGTIGTYMLVGDYPHGNTEYLDRDVPQGEAGYLIAAVTEDGELSERSSFTFVTIGQATLSMNDVRALAGETGTLVIRATNPNAIANDGLSLQVQYDASLLTPVAIRSTELTSAFSFTSNIGTANGTLLIEGVDTGESVAGEGALIEVDFDFDAAMESWETSELSFGNVTLFDVYGEAHPVVADDLARAIVEAPIQPGDVSRDGYITILDAVMMRRLILDLWEAGDYARMAADMNADTLIDGADLGLLLKALVGPRNSGRAQADVTKAHPAEGYILSVGEQRRQGSTFEMPLMLNAIGDIQSMDLVLRYDPEALELRSVSPGSDLGSVFWESKNETPGLVHVSMSLMSTPTADNPVMLELGFESLDDWKSTDLYVTHFKLSDDSGRNLARVAAVKSGSIELLQAPRQPENLTPVNGSTDLDPNVMLTGSTFFDPEINRTHLASQWQVRTLGSADDFSSTVYDSGATDQALEAVQLSLGDIYYSGEYAWRHRHRSSSLEWSEWSDPTTFSTIMTVPDVPTTLQPEQDATLNYNSPTLAASAFNDVNPMGTHQASQWQIRLASDADYSLPVVDSGAVSPGVTSWPIEPGILEFDADYRWRVRYQNDQGHWSAWSAEGRFVIGPEPIFASYQPINQSPVDGDGPLGRAPALYASAFDDPEGYTHLASQWQLRESTSADDFSEPVLDSGEDTTALEGYSIPIGVLQYGTTYAWRVRYRNSAGQWSLWSSPTQFSVVGSDAVQLLNDFYSGPVLGAVFDIHWKLNKPVAGTAVAIELWRWDEFVAELATGWEENGEGITSIQIPGDAEVGRGYSLRIVSIWDESLWYERSGMMITLPPRNDVAPEIWTLYGE